MASDSLGTMTVGVTANVSEAERALNGLANMLEKFERQQQSRQRSAATVKRGAGTGYFAPMSEEFAAEATRISELQKRTEETLRFRDIRKTEIGAITARGTEPQMARVAEEFRDRQAREIDDLQVYAERQERIEKKRNDKIVEEGERFNQHMAALGREFLQIQQREIDDLQVYAERQERVEKKKTAKIIDDAEQFNQHMAALGRQFAVYQKNQIDDLQVYAERQERIEKKKNDKIIEEGERFNQHMAALGRQFAVYQKEQIDELQLYAERQEQIERDAGQALNDHMQELGRQFKAGNFNDGPGGFGGVGDSANRARFAVMNLAYGVQDFAQVIGTGGFPAAIRASANNLTGLAALFDKTAYASGGLKAALMTPEVAVIAVATAALFAADAWEKYRKKVKEAADEAAKAKFEKFDPGKAVEEAGRAERFAIDIENAKTVAEAEKVINRVRDDDRIKAKEERAAAGKAADLRVEKAKAEAALATKRQAEAKAEMQLRMGAAGPGGVGAGFERMEPMTQEERRLAAMDEAGLVAEVEQAAKKLKEAEEAVNDAIDDRIQLIKELDAAERNLRRAKRDDAEDRFNRAFAENMRQGQRDEEDRIRIGRRDFAESVRKMESDVMELERKARFDPFANTAAAGRNTAAEYEALVRARAPGNMEANDLSAMKQLLQEQKEILRKIEENTKETYEGPPPTVDELINGV
tara:strand:+ start:88 stop:2184 length:2097 start_codon:yes stop_codon:yes gene_type:complete